MTTGRVLVEMLGRKDDGERRFVVWAINLQTFERRGPDGGEDQIGYTEAELRAVLGLKVPQDGVDALIAEAKARTTGA